MLHLLYIVAFTIIAFIAVSNLIRSLVSLGTEVRRPSSADRKRSSEKPSFSRSGSAQHPELLDESGKPTDEPLLVMRSVDVEEARGQLDALYNNSPGSNKENSEES
ncbi:MAG: DUF2973 domain-containing protein [Cyanobacteria bacterium QS_7_48_42]|nr:MAG: DUF2973 domain-containing protein [Cyanobacteria bacterium QH_10_48_56]PSO61003.1 MAG: DUF2973 domain-containing protein [Cyanobacteria bacterium QH_7_48_89]PSO66274.1 MAG: DUF2973 domain-containing protein [Cyanobacteria bacterium QH_2_48_84]PSO70491.1 MAG: DUF2973 domain-containing protein [Cyanobacteria bacterium QH_3_48_40]PSO82470.1 MAG: DUF2973 domain-containing protein [Cyanobacteria bacterium QS_4_48_99]PSO86693.1 MAG: DUF2973 domain-containing protein [Cyanobacteria bacterium 